ncbi:MAG: hypothetical protein AAF928_00485 [Myxococcota bacterium]
MRCAAVLVLALALATVGCSQADTSRRDSASKDDDDGGRRKKREKKKRKERDEKPKKGGEASNRPKACVRAAPPSKGDLGLKPADFIACLEALLDETKLLGGKKLPDAATRPFEKKADGQYTVDGFMAVQMKLEGGRIASMDVFFFNDLRKEHGMGVELAGQYATLAAVFPSLEFDPLAGKATFREIDAIGKKTNQHLIRLERDDITLEASFLPMSVRYRFRPKR